MVSSTLHIYLGISYFIIKVKESRNRPSVAHRVPRGLGSQIFMRSSAPRTGRLYPQECSWYSFSLGAMVRSEGNMSLKNPVTPPGIDPGTVRLVAQRPNHYATPGPHHQVIHSLISKQTMQYTMFLSTGSRAHL